MYIHMTQLSWMYKNIHIHDLLYTPWNHLFHLRSKSRPLFHYNSQGWRQWNEDHSNLHSLIGLQQQLPIWGGEYWLTHGNEATPPKNLLGIWFFKVFTRFFWVTNFSSCFNWPFQGLKRDLRLGDQKSSLELLLRCLPERVRDDSNVFHVYCT